MADPMTPEDEQRIRELLDMHPALLQPEAIELRRHLLDARDDLASVRAELAKERELRDMASAIAEQATDLHSAARAEVTRWQERDAQTAALLKHIEAERDEAIAALDRLRANALKASEELRTANGRITQQAEEISALTLKLARAERQQDEARGQRDEAYVKVAELRAKALNAIAQANRLAKQVERARDIDLIRRAISDPGAFVERKRINDGDYERLPAWSARAVICALDGEEARS